MKYENSIIIKVLIYADTHTEEAALTAKASGMEYII
jgi:hypothetical protein